MRELKYRMWNKKEKKMYQVGVLDFDDEKAYMKNYLSYTVSNYMFEDIELMQFTGLYDKNGKEIYESDIVEVTRQCIWEKGIVVFIDGCFFIKVSETLLALYECEPNNYELKAIGNIYENPDLLKGADNIE